MLDKFNKTYRGIIKETCSTEFAADDDKKIIMADEDFSQTFSVNDLKKELAERQADGSIDKEWTIEDYIKEITGKNGQCHWIKDHEKLFGKEEEEE